MSQALRRSFLRKPMQGQGKRKVAGGGGSGDEDRNVNAELMGKDIEFVLLEFG